MSISHLLESFQDTALDDSRPISMSELTLEEEKLEAFERGYKAGWDDAAKAQEEDRDRITSDFANNLQELSFTYQEAYGHLARALKPVLQQMVDSVLPGLARQALGPQIVEQLTELAAGAGRQEVEIVVSPGNAPLMRGLLRPWSASRLLMSATLASLSKTSSVVERRPFPSASNRSTISLA